MTIRVLIVDDHSMVRVGRRKFLRRDPDLEVVDEAADGTEAIAKARQWRPDVVLMDLLLPGRDGVSAIATIRQELPETQVLVLTGALESTLVAQAIRAGANGYLLKDAHATELRAALKERQRLARELHDSAVQQCYGLSLSVQSAIETLPAAPEEALDLLKCVLQYAEAAQAELRTLIFELRSETLETEGLVGALRKHAELLRLAYHLTVNAVLEQEPEMPLEGKEALYRIAQEALHNVVKHARANFCPSLDNTDH